MTSFDECGFWQPCPNCPGDGNEVCAVCGTSFARQELTALVRDLAGIAFGYEGVEASAQGVAGEGSSLDVKLGELMTLMHDVVGELNQALGIDVSGLQGPLRLWRLRQTEPSNQ